LYVARHLFARAVPKYSFENNGPFKLFCENLQPRNVLVDPQTHRITAVIDLKFTNAMPAQFAYDPPWWLLLTGPDEWVQRGREMKDFVTAYIPRMEQFVRTVERIEGTGLNQPNSPRLSLLMRDSWNSKRFWFNYAARKPFAVDYIFNEQLNPMAAGVEGLNDRERSWMEVFVKKKMEQLKEYQRDCKRLKH
jgi:hypothetical protein